MPEPTPTALLDALRETFKEVRTLRKEVHALAQHLGAVERPARQAAGGAPAVATDAELDSQYGDPEIRKDPPRWDGESFKGCKMSEATPEYLDSLAGFLDWRAGKKREEAAELTDEDDETKAERAKAVKYAGYDEKDAARARGWARRKRAEAERAEQDAARAAANGAGSDGAEDFT